MPPGSHRPGSPREETRVRVRCLEADFASGHGIAQLSLVVDEGHQPHIGLDEEGALQDQHAASLAQQRTLLLGFFDSLD